MVDSPQGSCNNFETGPELEILYGVHEALDLCPERYPGGIAIWGALPAVYDTCSFPPEEGVHVHARKKENGRKSIDATFGCVRVRFSHGHSELTAFTVNADDAVSYTIGTILKRKIKCLRCPSCGGLHSDRNWHAVHYHRVHDCEHCGRQFEDSEPSISNPVVHLKELCGDVFQDRELNPIERKISVKQERFKYGVQLWGSNAAIIWTSPKLEENGIHFHGFSRNNPIPTVDETFGILEIDETSLNPAMVRLLMAQRALPYLRPYLRSLYCPSCKEPHFDEDDDATEPHHVHTCEHCGVQFSSEADHGNVISNPLIDVLDQCYQRFKALYPEQALKQEE